MFFCTLLIAVAWPSYAQVESAMTFNIRYDNPNDGENQWSNRREALVDLLNHYHPDVIGIQEGLVHQLEYLQENLKGYKMIGVGREDGKTLGEFTAIFYDATKLKLIEQSTFWLSETPATISVGWDAALERICTYALFENRNSKSRLYVFNTHYDHIGEVARVNSSKLVLQKISELNRKNVPLILMGDFNSTPDSESIQTIKRELNDGGVDEIYGPAGTFNDFNRQAELKNRIDYIFTKNLKIKNYRHVDDKMKNGNCVSDHLPVLINFK